MIPTLRIPAAPTQKKQHKIQATGPAKKVEGSGAGWVHVVSKFESKEGQPQLHMKHDFSKEIKEPSVNTWWFDFVC